MKRTIANIFRILAGFMLIFYAVIKALDPVGASIAMSASLASLFGKSMSALAMPLTLALLLTEFTLGVALIFRLLLSYAIRFSFLLSVFYVIISLFILPKEYYPFCGCGWELIFYNKKINLYFNFVLLFVMFFVLVFKKQYKPAKILEKYQLSWLLTSALAISVFVFINYTMLSLMDFTPFRRGTDLKKKLVVKTQDDKPDAEKNFFLHDSACFDNVNKFLTINNCYTDCKFNIINPYGQNITDSLLNLNEPLLLIIAYDLDKMNLRGFTKILKFARQFTDQYNNTAYCLTSSPPKVIDSIIELTGAYDIEFCHSDETTLKMLIRSNPGVMILKHGIIIAKRNYNTLPNLKRQHFYRKKIKPYEND